jgi:hypothetical protein
MLWRMDFYGKQILKTMSIAAMLASISGCTSDMMIRINSTSAITLVPNTEIRYKACGEIPTGCQAVFDSLVERKKKLIAIAREKAQEEMSKKLQRNTEKTKDCNELENGNRYIHDSNGKLIQRKATTEEIANCQNIISVISNDYEIDENTFKPTIDDTKKIIKEVSSSNLNEYTFSKADGSIVVICPTRYCAIGSGDGGWIGIGESGKSIDATSVVRAQS